ncbi:MAG: 3'(2'),5'-bisphosphate nucleotidase CysQ [Alphaproteobacteria bacterium]|nr:3'(2'),5'-bisphosphate nucleotidase CysQ [Alphaproteobacteria bacterium]
MTSPKLSPNALILADLARRAGALIMEIYGTNFSAEEKADLSPVTIADEQAEMMILAGLKKAFPDIPVIAEESAATGRIPKVNDQFFLVDPLDGTKEFLSRNGEFTVNIAMVKNGVPVLGVVYAPALSKLYVGELGLWAAMADIKPTEPLISATWQKLAVRRLPAEGATVLASRSHRDAETEAYLATLQVKKIIGAGSSLKFCSIAAGEADIYPRFGRTMEWDTAAGQAVLTAAGGKVCTTDNQSLCYGKVARGFDNPAFIASA